MRFKQKGGSPKNFLERMRWNRVVDSLPSEDWSIDVREYETTSRLYRDGFNFVIESMSRNTLTISNSEGLVVVLAGEHVDALTSRVFEAEHRKKYSKQNQLAEARRLRGLSELEPPFEGGPYVVLLGLVLAGIFACLVGLAYLSGATP